MGKKLILLFTLFLLLLPTTGCDRRLSRPFEDPEPNDQFHTNVYQNNTYSFIMVVPDSNWQYLGIPKNPLIKHASAVVRFEKIITANIPAFLEISIMDISEIVTPGTTDSSLANKNIEWIDDDDDTFPSYVTTVGVAATQINHLSARDFEFTASANAEADYKIQYRFIGHRKNNGDYYYIFLCGIKESEWALAAAELDRFIQSFYFNEEPI